MAPTPLASDDRDDRIYGLDPEAAQQFLDRSEDGASEEPQREPPESFWTGETANDEPLQLQLEIGEPVYRGNGAAREEPGDESGATATLVEADDARPQPDAPTELMDESSTAAELGAAPPPQTVEDSDTPAIDLPGTPQVSEDVALVEATYAPEFVDTQSQPIALHALPPSEPNDATADSEGISEEASATEAPGLAPGESFPGGETIEVAVSEIPQLLPTTAPDTAVEATSPIDVPEAGADNADADAPLVNALDAAVKLAADANAAAEALESLKRLLERRAPETAGVSAPSMPALAEPGPAVIEPSTPSVRLQPTRPPASVKPPPLALPPLPLHSVRNSDGTVALRPALLPQPRHRVVAERRRFDVRGFFAGFALSWAFGVVLYLFLTAG